MSSEQSGSGGRVFDLEAERAKRGDAEPDLVRVDSAPLVVVTPSVADSPEWFGKLLAIGPSAHPLACEADSCVVLPIERGATWSKKPLVLRKARVQFVERGGRRREVGATRLHEFANVEGPKLARGLV